MPIQERESEDKISNRRLRYATDETYRNKAKDISRNGYRKRVGLETESCLYSLQFLDKLAKDFTVRKHDGEHSKTIRGFSVSMASEALQQLYQTVWRWIQNGIIPAPIFVRVNVSGSRPYYVYHLEEVRILVEEIGEHEKNMAYLRKDHTEVRGRIEQRFSKFRNTLKF